MSAEPASTASSSAQAAGLAELEDLFTTRVETSIASKVVESIEEAPSIVAVVSGVEIRRWGYRSVAEVLRHVVGFYLVDDHILPNLLVRGIGGGLGNESGLIKLMINGHSVSHRYTRGNWLGTELVPLSMVERIEVVRGPASSLYGADAFLGAVNIVTISPSKALEGSVQASAGVTGQEPGGYADGTVAGRHAGLEWSAGFALERTDRSGLELPTSSPAPVVPEDRAAGDRVARGLARDSRVWLLQSTYRFNDRVDLDLYGRGSYVTRGGDFSRWAQLVEGAATEPGTTVALRQHEFGIQAHFHPTQTFDVTLGVAGFEGGPRSADRIEVASSLYSVERRGGYVGEHAHVEARWRIAPSLRAVAGAETSLERHALETPLRVSKLTGEAFEEEAPVDTRSVLLWNPGAFGQLHWDAWQRYLKLVGGVRYDWHSVYGSQVSERLAAISRLSDDLFFKALYGRAFAAPSPQLLYGDPLRPGDIIGNDRLRPQYVRTFEVQLGFNPQRYVTLSTDVSYSILVDKAEFVPQGINKAAQNIASVKSLAWENLVKVQYRDLLHSYLGVEFVRAHRDLDLSYQQQLLGSRNGVYPPWILKGGASFETPIQKAPLTLSTQAIWLPERDASTDNIFARGAVYRVPAVLLWDASLTVSTRSLLAPQRSSIGLSAKNLLGLAGPDPGFGGIDYPLPGRELMLMLRQEI